MEAVATPKHQPSLIVLLFIQLQQADGALVVQVVIRRLLVSLRLEEGRVDNNDSLSTD
jgi:hypothetical protein